MKNMSVSITWEKHQQVDIILKLGMVFSPVSAQFFTLLAIVFIGEGVREAFDPKVYSRLR